MTKPLLPSMGPVWTKGAAAHSAPCFKVSPVLQKTFYSAVVESVLTANITVWQGNCSAQDRKAVIRCAEKHNGEPLSDLMDIHNKCCRLRASLIMKDLHHPNNKLFEWLSSVRQLLSLQTRTESLKRSFPPQAIRIINKIWFIVDLLLVYLCMHSILVDFIIF